MLNDATVVRAFHKALRRMNPMTGMVKTEVSAGFFIPKGQKRGHRRGLQVFVTVYRYSDEMKTECPLSGGLLGFVE